MKPWVKRLVIAAVQIVLVASLGAKLLYDRAVQPRVWVRTAPYDPDLPIRGRYVSLQLVVEPRGVNEPKEEKRWHSPQPVVLSVEGDRLVAEAHPQERGHDPSDLHVQFISSGGEKLAVLAERVAFFIPEHIPDPSRRPAGEQLWTEVTIPKKGPPRPIRLGVRKGEGVVVPFEIR